MLRGGFFGSKAISQWGMLCIDGRVLGEGFLRWLRSCVSDWECVRKLNSCEEVAYIACEILYLTFCFNILLSISIITFLDAFRSMYKKVF